MSTREQFTRDEIQRLLDLSEAQLSYWERLGLAQPRKSEGRSIYDFRDIISLRTAKQLINDGVPAHKLRRALLALEEKLGEVRAPLTELRITSDGKQLVVEHAGARLEPLTGQFMLNFETRELGEKVRAFPAPGAAAPSEPAPRGDVLRLPPPPAKNTVREFRAERTGFAPATAAAGAATSAATGARPATPAEEWIAQAQDAELRGSRADAMAAYERALEFDPRHVQAWINLGTLRYEHSEFQGAYECFRRAAEIAPGNGLALYNVGCVLEDLGQVHSAREYLRAAVRLEPSFADAHYNLALVCERLGALAEAAPHWRRYLELDPTSPWCDYARRRAGPQLV